MTDRTSSDEHPMRAADEYRIQRRRVVNQDTQDTDVLGRARAGDERAFLALYRAAQPGLLRYLTVLAGDAAEKIAADTWVEVGADLGSFAGTLEGFRGWVAGIGRRRVLDHLADIAAGTAPDTTRDATGGGPTPPRTARALGLIAHLPREEAEAIALRSVMGLGEGEAADVLGVRRGALRRTALRGLRALARRLDPVMERPAGRGAADPSTPASPVRNLRVLPGGGEGSGSGRARLDRVEIETGHGIEVSS